MLMKCFLNYSLLDPLIIDMHRWSRSVLLWRWSLWCVYCKRYSHQCNDNGSDNGALVDIIIISRSGWNTFSSCCRHWICTIQGKWDKKKQERSRCSSHFANWISDLQILFVTGEVRKKWLSHFTHKLVSTDFGLSKITSDHGDSFRYPEVRKFRISDII